MIAFLKYMRGYLRIRVSGFSPERFMNLCSNKGILLWEIAREGEVYEMNIDLKGFWKLRPIARKTGTRVAILRRYGFPFFLPGLLKRKFFVLGLMLAVCFLLWSSGYVWDIRLSGNHSITEDIFMDFLKENRITEGMPKRSVDIEKIEKEIRKSFRNVTWASAKLTGTKLYIEIKENDAPILPGQKAETGESEGKDIAAEFDGTVVSIIVRKGIPQVSVGDTVEKGRILVGGEIPVYNDDASVREYYYVDADADIVMEHAIEYSDSLSADYIRKEYTGREKENYYLRVGKKELRAESGKPFLVYDSIIKESRPLFFQKLSVPVYFGSCRYREYKNVEYRYDKEQAREKLNEKIEKFLESLKEKGVQIIEKDVKIDSGSTGWTVYGTFLVREPAGMSTVVEKTMVGDTGDP